MIPLDELLKMEGERAEEEAKRRWENATGWESTDCWLDYLIISHRNKYSPINRLKEKIKEFQ